MPKEQNFEKYYYTEVDLGFDPAEVWIVNTLQAVASHKIVVTLGFVAILLSALAIHSNVSRNMDNSQMPTVTVSRTIEDPTPKSPVQLAQDRLNQLQDPNGRSFKEVMRRLGHQVGDLQYVGHKSGIVGDEGLIRRNYPAVGSEIVFNLKKWLGFGHIYAGEEVDWDGELEVLTGSVVDRFAHRIPDSQNPPEHSDEYIRLGQRVLGGLWDPFVIEK